MTCENNQQFLDIMRALSLWLDNQEHKTTCEFGQVVQSGPAEGNKIPCSCGLTVLQTTVDSVIRQ